MSDGHAPADAAIDPRYPASSIPSITTVRLSPGDGVDLVNISRSGVLVEGRTRFVPGTRVTVIVDGGFTPPSIRGKIVRCQVSSISGGALRYQSGIQFEKRLDALEPHPAHAGSVASPQAPQASAAPRAATPAPAVASSSAPGRVVNRW